ncbi:MAG: tetratricopeptide repeat protein, partial [Gammaproteobacteria bacterium]
MRHFTALLLVTLMTAGSVQAGTLSDAKIAIRTQNYDKAARLLRPLADSGDKDAQYQLAVLYRNGQGVKQNPAKAAQWMKMSAKQGHASAQYSMGIMYTDGTGVPESRKLAAFWLSHAAQQGHKHAARKLEQLQSGKATGIDTTAISDDPDEALVLAVIAGNLASAEKLLKAGVSANTRDQYQRPVILEAVAREDVPMT